MRTIGVIADTHGLLREEALAALDGSDLILHAGDVGRVEILEALRRIAPVWAVRGNTDFGALASALPATQVVDLLAADGQPAPMRAIRSSTWFLAPHRLDVRYVDQRNTKCCDYISYLGLYVVNLPKHLPF